MTAAADRIRANNTNALIAYENDLTIGIEHHTDPDGRLFTLEYAATHDGDHAVSFCRYSPWGPLEGNWVCHVNCSGLICTGNRIHHLSISDHASYDEVKHSPYDVDWIIARSRYWTAIYSYFRETGIVAE